MRRFIYFALLTVFLAGCSGSLTNRDWHSEDSNAPISVPYQLGQKQNDTNNYNKRHNIAVLLPTSGASASVGRGIRSGVELAILQQGIENLSVSFYDTATSTNNAIKKALDSNPDIIIGPLFSQNVELLRDSKATDIPAITFTSDANALGDGVLTVNLMPTNSIELIVREMQADNINDFIIIAPNNDSGKIMAGAAKNAGEIYGPNVRGIFFYEESDNESFKNVSMLATMNTARTSANKRAREILSDILTNETITGIEKSNLYYQLDKLEKTETLGELPYTAVLFLGNANDSKSIASFLRYYGADSRNIRFYGTAMWDNTDIISDFTMNGAKYAALPNQDSRFSTLYEYTYGSTPSRLETFGYDAANIAIGTLYSQKTFSAYLLDPSGYKGANGIIRLKPNGDSEHGLRILELNGSGSPRTIKNDPENFIVPIYNIEQRKIKPAYEMGLQTEGINPIDYIKIPNGLRKKYKSKTYGTNIIETPTQKETSVVILPEDDSEPIKNTDYQSVKIENINKTIIDSVEIEE